LEAVIKREVSPQVDKISTWEDDQKLSMRKVPNNKVGRAEVIPQQVSKYILTQCLGRRTGSWP
jgi:hypothetical protein